MSGFSPHGELRTWNGNCMQGNHLYPMDWVSKGEVGLSQQWRWMGQPFSAGNRTGTVSSCSHTPPRLVLKVVPVPGALCCQWGEIESRLPHSPLYSFPPLFTLEFPPALNSTRVQALYNKAHTKLKTQPAGEEETK